MWSSSLSLLLSNDDVRWVGEATTTNIFELRQAKVEGVDLRTRSNRAGRTTGARRSAGCRVGRRTFYGRAEKCTSVEKGLLLHHYTWRAKHYMPQRRRRFRGTMLKCNVPFPVVLHSLTVKLFLLPPPAIQRKSMAWSILGFLLVSSRNQKNDQVNNEKTSGIIIVVVVPESQAIAFCWIMRSRRPFSTRQLSALGTLHG